MRGEYKVEGGTFTATARGDLDCDGVYSTFTLRSSTDGSMEKEAVGMDDAALGPLLDGPARGAGHSSRSIQAMTTFSRPGVSSKMPIRTFTGPFSAAMLVTWFGPKGTSSTLGSRPFALISFSQ